MNLLFVCDKNVMRSRTAEAIYNGSSQHRAKSAGVAHNSKVNVTPNLIHWADIIFVMEEEHKEYLTREFPADIGFREIIILGIDDFYYYMDPELVTLIKDKVDPYLEQ